MKRVEVWRNGEKVGYLRSNPMAVVDERGGYLRPCLIEDMLKAGAHEKDEANQQKGS